MVTMWTMIIEDNDLSLNSHFYHVECGSSAAAQKAMFFLGGYCHSHHYYLRKRDNEDAQFRLNVAESLGVKVYDLPCMVAKVETLVSHLRKHGCLPFTPMGDNNRHVLKQKTDTKYRFLCNTMCLKRGT